MDGVTAGGGGARSRASVARRGLLATVAVLAATGAALVLGHRAHADLSGLTDAAAHGVLVAIGPDLVVTAGLTSVGALVAAWLAGSMVLCLLCAAARAGGRSWRAGDLLARRIAPRVVRRLTAVTLGATVAAGASVVPAHALGDALDPSWRPVQPTVRSAMVVAPMSHRSVGSTPDDHRVLPLPAALVADGPGIADGPGSGAGEGRDAGEVRAAAAEGPVAEHGVEHGADQPRHQGESSTAVVVRAGDTLWSIAQAHLPAGSSHADIARAWPLWFEANRQVIGGDPHLVIPGQVLVPPTSVSPDRHPS